MNEEMKKIFDVVYDNASECDKPDAYKLICNLCNQLSACDKNKYSELIVILDYIRKLSVDGEDLRAEMTYKEGFRNGIVQGIAYSLEAFKKLNDVEDDFDDLFCE